MIGSPQILNRPPVDPPHGRGILVNQSRGFYSVTP